MKNGTGSGMAIEVCSKKHKFTSKRERRDPVKQNRKAIK